MCWIQRDVFGCLDSNFGFPQFPPRIQHLQTFRPRQFGPKNGQNWVTPAKITLSYLEATIYLRGPRGPPGSSPTGSTRSRRDPEQRRKHQQELLPLPHRAVKKMWPTRFPGALINRDARRVRFWARTLDFLVDNLLLVFSWQFY